MDQGLCSPFSTFTLIHCQNKTKAIYEFIRRYGEKDKFNTVVQGNGVRYILRAPITEDQKAEILKNNPNYIGEFRGIQLGRAVFETDGNKAIFKQESVFDSNIEKPLKAWVEQGGELAPNKLPLIAQLGEKMQAEEAIDMTLAMLPMIIGQLKLQPPEQLREQFAQQKDLQAQLASGEPILDAPEFAKMIKYARPDQMDQFRVVLAELLPQASEILGIPEEQIAPTWYQKEQAAAAATVPVAVLQVPAKKKKKKDNTVYYVAAAVIGGALLLKSMEK